LLAAADIAEATLAAATAVDEVKLLRDQASTVVHYARRQRRSLEALNRWAEIKLRCERKLGRALAERAEPRGRWLREETTGEMRGATATLPAGITKIQSLRYRRAASVPEDKFVTWMAEKRTNDEELTTAGLLALATPTEPDDSSRPVFDIEPVAAPADATSDTVSDTDPTGGYPRRLILTFNVETHAQVERWLADLGRAFGTSNPSTTLVALMNGR